MINFVWEVYNFAILESWPEKKEKEKRKKKKGGKAFKAKDVPWS